MTGYHTRWVRPEDTADDPERIEEGGTRAHHPPAAPPRCREGEAEDHLVGAGLDMAGDVLEQVSRIDSGEVGTGPLPGGAA
jgi:hypothetical protein